MFKFLAIIYKFETFFEKIEHKFRNKGRGDGEEKERRRITYKRVLQPSNPLKLCELWNTLHSSTLFLVK